MQAMPAMKNAKMPAITTTTTVNVEELVPHGRKRPLDFPVWGGSATFSLLELVRPHPENARQANPFRVLTRYCHIGAFGLER